MTGDLITIYKIANTVNEKVYIGQTWETMQHRFSHHCKPSSGCVYLRHAIQKYGKEHFSIEAVCYALGQKDADYWESHFIQKYDTTDHEKGYNLRDGGSNGKHSEVTKKKISESQKGNTYRLGKLASEETKKRISQSKQNLSEETRKKMSDSHKGHAVFPYHKGKTWKLLDGKRVWVSQ